MNKIPRSIYSLTTMLLYVLAVPVFFLGFIMLYESQWMIDFLNTKGTMLVFNTLMLMCILLGVECGSRIPMTACRKHIQLTWWQFALWSLGEIVVFACFAALYMALIERSYGYFPALGQCLLISICTLSIPYLLIPTLVALIKPDEMEGGEESLIRFADSTGRLKLVIAQDVLLNIMAQENYVVIRYMEGELQKEYSLRQSMRGIEELMEKHDIVRCHRSFFINPRHIKVLRRDKEGVIQAELDVPNSKSVPVSPKYYDQLNKML